MKNEAEDLKGRRSEVEDHCSDSDHWCVFGKFDFDGVEEEKKVEEKGERK